MAVARDLFFEDSPMTLQIALRASDYSLVLASDRKTRSSESEASRAQLAVTSDSKIHICSKHKIAIALSGSIFGQDCAPAIALTSHLDQLTATQDLTRILTDWGNSYFRQRLPDQDTNACVIRLLLVNAQTPQRPFYVLEISQQSPVIGLQQDSRRVHAPRDL